MKTKLTPNDWSEFGGPNNPSLFEPYRREIIKTVLQLERAPFDGQITMCKNIGILQKYIQLPLNNTTFPSLDTEDENTMLALRDTHARVVIDAIGDYLSSVNYFNNSANCMSIVNDIIGGEKSHFPELEPEETVEKIFANINENKATNSILPSFLQLQSFRQKREFYNTISNSEPIYKENHPNMEPVNRLQA